MSQLSIKIEKIEENVQFISRLHDKALVGVSQEETNRITRQLDAVQDETNDLMDQIRVQLKKIATETKRLGGTEAQSRKAQQSSIAQRLQTTAQRYAQVQKNAKNQYKKRMERELRIGIFVLI